MDIEEKKPSKEHPEILQPETLPEGEVEIAQEHGVGEQENIDHKELREKIEKADIDDSLKLQASAHENDVQQLEDEKKIAKLLELAQSKGVIYAVHVAKKLDDPYLLDKLHDTLAEKGYYKSLKF